MGIRLDHIGIAVDDLDSGSTFWQLLGLIQGEDERNDEQGVNIRFFATEEGANPTRIELLAPTGGDTPIGRFLEKKGAGIQQIAFRVDDLDSLLSKLKSEGVRLINESPTRGHTGVGSPSFIHQALAGSLSSCLSTMIDLGVNGWSKLF